MQIRVTARGDPDAAPAVCSFERGGDAEEVFAASVKGVAESLKRGGRINITQALLLLAARATDPPYAGEEGARREASALLTADRVMIGVPEMTRRVDIDARSRRGSIRVRLESPIGPPSR